MRCVVGDNTGSKEMNKGARETAFRRRKSRVSESAGACGRSVSGWECWFPP